MGSTVLTGVSLLAGGGFASIGMAAAGVQLVGACDSDPLAAAYYALNLGGPVMECPIEETDPAPFRGIDMLQGSPVCTRASQANQGATRGETLTDIAIGRALVRWIEVCRPRFVWFENVPAYRGFHSYRVIRAALDRLEYWSTDQVVNAADYGIPQSRQRLILRAMAGGVWQPHRPLPAPQPWRGWYDAVADLLPGLPPTDWAPWQRDKLPITVETNPRWEAGGWRAILVDSQQSSKHAQRDHLTIRFDNEPAYTVVASTSKGLARIVTPDGSIRVASPRLVARLQTIPDWYQLPPAKYKAGRLIGNGVPCQLAEVVTRSLLG